MRQLRQRFAFAGYWLIDCADLGVPQHRRRIIIWAGPAPLEAPTLTHGRGRLPWNAMGAALSLGDLGPWLTRPSPTVSAVGECKGSGPGGNPEKMQRASDALFMGTGRRRLTVKECAKLQAFPDDHPWQGTKAAQYRQVGNAVPPTLAKAVARQVVEADKAPPNPRPVEG